MLSYYWSFQERLTTEMMLLINWNYVQLPNSVTRYLTHEICVHNEKVFVGSLVCWQICDRFLLRDFETYGITFNNVYVPTTVATVIL